MSWDGTSGGWMACRFIAPGMKGLGDGMFRGDLVHVD